MSQDIQNYKRIARNTGMLYVRYLISLVISLFTSRVVLQALGFDDFGLYTVVGGFVSLLAFFNSYVSEGTVRFLTFALGRNDVSKLKQTFSAALALHVALAILILVLGETFGFWYVENKLNIVAGRQNAALFVFELTIITCCLSVMQIPFSASINSHEDMGIYAYISIFDVVMKLIIVYLLMVMGGDKLRIYAVFYFCVSLLTSLFYLGFCVWKYPECRFYLKPDFKLYRQMFGFIGWKSVGAVAFTLNNQGITLLLNIFFGTVINAARGVAGSISNVVSQFVFNFQSAMVPQIVKTYANGDVVGMNSLVIYCARYSSYLCMLFGIPLAIEADTILNLWLVEVPPYAATFCRLTIIQIMIQAIDFPVGYGINAVGKMKLPNLTSSLVYLLILPISWLAMKMGANPTIFYLVSILAYPGTLFFDVWILAKYTHFDIREYYTTVVLRTILFIVIAGALPLVLHFIMPMSFLRLCVILVLSLSVSCLIIFYKGLDAQARKLVSDKLHQKVPFLFRQ